MSLSVYVFGVSGRMGQEVKSLVESHPKLDFVGGMSRKNKDNNPTKKPDIVIDFSLPESLPHLCEFVAKYKPCVVSGTTGLSAAQFNNLKALGSKSPVFWSANMSFGIYLMCRMTEMLARYENFYNFEIEETHHIHKKDKPSGTALIIEDAARRSTQKLKPTVSLREGEVFGIHRFIANSTNEQLEIRHEAFNRGLFAQGAIDVALWLHKQKAGYYQMEDFFASFQ